MADFTYYPPMTNLPVENSAANDPCPRRGAMKQVDGEYRAKLIILAEEDRLTTETKRALLAHNEAWIDFCK